MLNKTVRLIGAGAIAAASLLLAAVNFRVPMDPDAGKKTDDAIRAALEDANYPLALRQCRRMLELYPNNPMLQAPVYVAMADVAQKAGDDAAAAVYADVARHIDASLEKRMQDTGGATTRGDGVSKWAKALTVASNAMQAAQNISAQIQQQRLAAQAIAMQRQSVPLPQYAQPQPAVVYPPAPLNDPRYQPNTVAGAPMPGWAPPPQPAAQAYYPPPPSSPAPQPTQVQYPQPTPSTPAQPAEYPQPPSSLPARVDYAPAQAQFPNAPPPYTASNYVNPGGGTRGEKPMVIKVVHDHAQLGDTAYFERFCGALITVAGGNLLFTGSGGEAAVVIPSSEILEIRLNTAVGKELGAFHVATKRGLYLNLLPEAADAETGRANVATLRQLLGLL